jgi:hypothetical protein
MMSSMGRPPWGWPRSSFPRRGLPCCGAFFSEFTCCRDVRRETSQLPLRGGWRGGCVRGRCGRGEQLSRGFRPRDASRLPYGVAPHARDARQISDDARQLASTCSILLFPKILLEALSIRNIDARLIRRLPASLGRSRVPRGVGGRARGSDPRRRSFGGRIKARAEVGSGLDGQVPSLPEPQACPRRFRHRPRFRESRDQPTPAIPLSLTGGCCSAERRIPSSRRPRMGRGKC